MNIRNSFVLGLLVFISVASFPACAFDSGAHYQKVNDGKFFDRLEKLKNKAILATGSGKSPGAPRVVARGARPEIIIRGDVIYFNGSGLKIGDSLTSWKKVLSAGGQCGKGDGIIVCVWDKWGIEVGTDDKKNPGVEFMNLVLNFSDDDGNSTGKINTLFGKSGRPENEKEHRRGFSGYLELDGFGIDSETKFWEVQTGTGNRRGLTCGLLDCSHPGGAFGKNARIFLTLNGRDDRATLRQLSISAANYK